MTNEKDANVIHNLFAEFHYADDLGVIKSKLAEYIATARKEEREAAFKDAVSVVTAKADELRQTEPFGTGVISASVQILEALERAAVATENRKGEG